MAMTRVQKLERKGIIWFEIDDVFAALTAKQSEAQGGSSVRMPVTTLARVTASLAGVIRERMSTRGETASGALALKRNGKPRGVDTGGMWKGVQARGTGKDSTLLDFGGQSQSMPSFHDMRIQRLQQKGRKWRLSTLENERNDLKASFIFSRHSLNVLEPSDREIASMAAALGDVWGRQMWAAVAGKATGLPAPTADVSGVDGSLRARFAAAAA